MAEALVSLLLEQFASILKAQVEQEVPLVVDVKNDVAKLTRHFKAIEAVLEDAEERQVKEADVRNWLESLKDVSYEMDDVLDEWNTEILKQSIQKQEKEAGKASVPRRSKVCFYIPAAWLCFGQVSHLIHRRDIALKIKELNERLTSIASERENYHFQYIKRSNQQLEHRKTSSFVGQTFGRVDEKLILVSKLLSESNQGGVDPLVIPRVGMGGIGKTCLAQIAYNDEKVQAHFDSRVWVCVSDPFDEIKIARAIIEGLRKSSAPTLNELQTLLQFLDESIKGKKFLLVLDDVWTEDHGKWEQLMLSLQNGAKGSKIVVTTRKVEVVVMMGATNNAINLKTLSEENCWLLFCQIAFRGRDRHECRGLEVIGRAIVKRCKGLPLAAKTLGGLMLFKKNKREWQEVLSNKIWELDVVEQEVFQPLLLSYYDLDSAIKRCLLYCVIFPKDTVINKEN